ncbi:TPA: hypothetical protein ACX6Q7_001705 [Photobacterium damselae]
MISNKTKIEQSSSKIVNKSSFQKIEISFDSTNTSKDIWSFMEGCFQTQSKANIVKQVITLLSGPLVSCEKSYFDQLKYDQLSKVVGNDLYNSINKEKSDLISIKAPMWQVSLVASSLPQCDSSNDFIELCLYKAYETLLRSFFDGGL